MGKGWASLILQPARRGRYNRLWLGNPGPLDNFCFGFLFISSSFLSAGGTGASAGDGAVDVEVGLVVVVGALSTVKTSRIFSLSITNHSPQSLR